MRRCRKSGCPPRRRTTDEIVPAVEDQDAVVGVAQGGGSRDVRADAIALDRHVRGALAEINAAQPVAGDEVSAPGVVPPI